MDLKKAQTLKLTPEIGDGYSNGTGPDVYLYQTTIEGLDAGDTYYFVIRARDHSEKQNEEKNTVVEKGVPINK